MNLIEKMKLRYAARSKKKEFGMMDTIILISVIIISLVMLGLLIFRMLKKKENYEDVCLNYNCKEKEEKIKNLEFNDKFKEAENERKEFSKCCNPKA